MSQYLVPSKEGLDVVRRSPAVTPLLWDSHPFMCRLTWFQGERQCREDGRLLRWADALALADQQADALTKQLPTLQWARSATTRGGVEVVLAGQDTRAVHLAGKVAGALPAPGWAFAAGPCGKITRAFWRDLESELGLFLRPEAPDPARDLAIQTALQALPPVGSFIRRADLLTRAPHVPHVRSALGWLDQQLAPLELRLKGLLGQGDATLGLDIDRRPTARTFEFVWRGAKATAPLPAVAQVELARLLDCAPEEARRIPGLLRRDKLTAIPGTSRIKVLG